MAALFSILCLIFAITFSLQPADKILSPLVSNWQPLKPLEENKASYEIFGFAPYWTFNNLDNVDFEVLTTLAYFGIEVDADGNLATEGPGYETFLSSNATRIFKRAHAHGTRVVLTLTQMKNKNIEAVLDSPEAQERVISQAVDMVTRRGIDGINVDFEYVGDPGQEYRDRFSSFIKRLTDRMHASVPASRVTVSVYASAVKEPKIYDIAAIGRDSDGVFMMAYDYATAGSDNAIPTAPLYGYKEGKYWYDVSTAVEDFTSLMPANKLILGVPWYGYNHVVYQPEVKAETRPYYSWRGRPMAQTYAMAEANVYPDMPDASDYKTGWDEYGQVGWRAYYLPAVGTWRMIFLEDERSLGKKYDFAKEKQLAGVGMWALGFDKGHSEMWDLLERKFGQKLADNTVFSKIISDNM